MLIKNNQLKYIVVVGSVVWLHILLDLQRTTFFRIVIVGFLKTKLNQQYVWTKFFRLLQGKEVQF
jgi:hypothetical protein